MKSLSRVRLLATPWTAAYQDPLSIGFSRVTTGAGNSTPRYASKRNENIMSTQKCRHKCSQQHLSSKKENKQNVVSPYNEQSLTVCTHCMHSLYTLIVCTHCMHSLYAVTHCDKVLGPAAMSVNIEHYAEWKPDMKGPTVNDPIDMKYQEKANLETESRLLVSGTGVKWKMKANA